MEHFIINNFEEFKQLQEYVAVGNYELVAFDTETDGVIEKTAKLYGLGLCFEEHEAFYIPIRNKDTTNYWTEQQEEIIKRWVYSTISSAKAIGHNAIYDILILLYNWNINLTDYLYSDTILQKHTLDEEAPHGLKETAVKYLGEWANQSQLELYENIKLNGGKTTKDNMQMFKADTNVLGKYCAFDTILTMKLFNLFEPRLKKEGLYNLFYVEEIMPLYKEVTIPMKIKGFPIDLEYFNNLNFNITKEIQTLEEKIQKDIEDLVKEHTLQILNEKYPAKRSGTFPKYVAQLISFVLPEKNGKITLAKKEIDQLEGYSIEHKNFLAWLRDEEELEPSLSYRAQSHWHKIDNDDTNYLFNLKSNNHLKWLFFDKLEEKSLSDTKGGEPQVDEDFLESIKTKHQWVQTFIDYKKLIKLKTTYIEGILEKQVGGVIYTSMLQFGTTSGRYASRSPNLQNLPSTKEDDSGLTELVIYYVNSIRKGFIAPEGYVLVDADQSALEPRCFASVSGDENLKKIFFNNEDMYSSIAIRSFKESSYSPFKSDPNYLGKHKPELRKIVKTYALAVAYGAGANRIADVLNIKKEEAQKLIDEYLAAYPSLNDYIKSCHKSANELGYVSTKFGRMRHLPRVKYLYSKHRENILNWQYVRKHNLSQEKYEYKNGLNNSTNMPIQGLAAHIMNRSAINISREFRKHNIDGYIALQVHDQIIAIVKKEQAQLSSKLVQTAMETSVVIDVPLIAEPKIANNMKESH